MTITHKQSPFQFEWKDDAEPRWSLSFSELHFCVLYCSGDINGGSVVLKLLDKSTPTP